ncbi:hypothetical protein RVV79_002824 [Burkholderia contaminans]|uniref:hypothetical protein n=1 Tax=Burkholderia contaminans TaxID=488447 RepID=UPI001453C54C|nr:hypothetical protein [Burkholderia contaminans]ELK6464143.1 hypothetical protein [Burkholderia contaminans]VWD38985.1 hypothetical protein BCO18442_05209 [Burkholderia contaminans]
MIPRNRTSRLAGTLGVFVKPYGRNAQKPLDPNDRRYDHDVVRTMRRLSPADLSDPLADDDGHADGAEAKAGFADVRRTP